MPLRSLARTVRRFASFGLAFVTFAAGAGCGGPPAPQTPPAPNTHGRAGRPRPCYTIHADRELRAKDAKKIVDELAKRIQLPPEDEAVRDPKSAEDIRTILRRDTVYLFERGADWARAQNTLDGRLQEATLELLLGESQLVASQVLDIQEAWVGGDLRVARANVATHGASNDDRARMLGQLIVAVEEGNKIADALGSVAPIHLLRGAEVVRKIQKEAPGDARSFALLAELHRLRGEWAEFDTAMRSAEGAERGSPPLCYLHAMEALERHRRPEDGKTKMRECLARFPRFVRAQAALVLMAGSPAEALRELERLQAMNPDHYLVMLLEPTLAADQELNRMQNEAPPAAAGVPSTGASAPAPSNAKP